jgi:putative FmdB family regulatory protein
MPSYDYKCKSCDNTVSLVVSIKDDPQTPVCVDCKAEMVRSYGIQAVQFKGSGWASKTK